MVTFINLISFLFNLWGFAILARVLISWLNVNPYHPAVRMLDMVTEPILEPLRRVIPSIGMIDISPIVALILVQVAERIVVSILWNLV